MNLREALLGAIGYQHTEGRDQAPQKWLGRIRKELFPAPLGYTIRVSGSGRTLPVIPWIAFLDPDVTTTAQDGMYVVYLFDADVRHVHLTMNQGVTQHRARAIEQGLKPKAAEDAAIAEISRETTTIRGALDRKEVGGRVDLGWNRFLARAYEAGAIECITYDLGALPSARELTIDLVAFLDLYAQCVSIKDELASSQQVQTSSRAKSMVQEPRPEPVFRPKNSDEYLARVAAHLQRRTRRHEALVREFGKAAQARGNTAMTNVHPRDLTLDSPAGHWLVEAKTTGGGTESAVRDAIGQLLAYRHFLYRSRGLADPHLLALFDQPIGGAFEELLASLEINVVWWGGDEWYGSPGGVALVT